MNKFRSELPENILIDKEIECKDFASELNMRDATLRSIGPCIDVDCSGWNKDKEYVLRVFNTYMS